MDSKRRHSVFPEKDVPNSKPPFLRLYDPLYKICRILGLFPRRPNILSPSNLQYWIVYAILFVINAYVATYKVIAGAIEMLTNITAGASTQLGLYIWFCLLLSSTAFLFQTGWKRKLEQVSELLYEATKQRALEIKYTELRRKFLCFLVLTCSLSLPLGSIFPAIYSGLFDSWPGIEGYRKMLFVDVWYLNYFFALVVAYDFMILVLWIVIYVTTCEYLKEEFSVVNEEIRTMNIRDNILFKEAALKHSRLLGCHAFLSNYLSVNIFMNLSTLTITSIIFAYVLLLDVDVVLRGICAFNLIGALGFTFTVCRSAETLSNAAQEGKQIVCARMAEEHRKSDLDEATFKTGIIITQQSAVETGISAFGFFAVSKETLLSLASFVATYVVIMIQSPSIMQEKSIYSDQNTTLIHNM